MVKERLSSIKNKVLVLSGKGGVGKSTVSAMLGRALTLDDSKEVRQLSHTDSTLFITITLYCSECFCLYLYVFSA